MSEKLLEKTISLEDLKEWGACYLDDENNEDYQVALRDLFSEPRTVLEVLTVTEPGCEVLCVNAHDRLWAVAREELMPRQVLFRMDYRLADYAMSLCSEHGSKMPDEAVAAFALIKSCMNGHPIDVDKIRPAREACFEFMGNTRAHNRGRGVSRVMNILYAALSPNPGSGISHLGHLVAWLPADLKNDYSLTVAREGASKVIEIILNTIKEEDES